MWRHALESTHIDPSAHLDVDIYRPRVPTESNRHPIDKRPRSPHLCDSDTCMAAIRCRVSAQTVMRASTDSSPGTAPGPPGSSIRCGSWGGSVHARPVIMRAFDPCPVSAHRLKSWVQAYRKVPVSWLTGRAAASTTPDQRRHRLQQGRDYRRPAVVGAH